MTNNLDVYPHGQPNLTVTNMAQLALRMVSGDYKTYPFTLYQMWGYKLLYLMARLGPGDLVHYETARGLIQLLGVSRKETRRKDQAGF